MSLATSSRAPASRLGLIAEGPVGAWRRHLEAIAQFGPERFVALCAEPGLLDDDRAYLDARGVAPSLYKRGEGLLAAAELEVLEIQAAPQRLSELALLAAEKTPALILAPPFACTAAAARALADMFERRETAVLALDPLRHNAMIARAERLLEKDEALGEVHSLRLKTQLGRYEDEAPSADPAQRLDAHGAAPLVLIERLLGPIAELFAYGSSQSRMLSYKFAKDGRYGVHEVTYSPELVFPPGGPNWLVTLELTGTDGVLWLNNLAGQPYMAPTLLLKRKDRTTAYDDRLEDEFGPLCEGLRARFVADPQPSRTFVAELRREALALEAAATSLAEARPVRL